MNIDDLHVTENCVAYLRVRFGHRSSTFCGHCASNRIKPFLAVINAEIPTDAELDVLYSVEAHVDRTFGTGGATSTRPRLCRQLW